MSTLESIFVVSGLLLALSILASRLSSRLGMPLLLVFLALGMLAGEQGVLGIQFNDYDLAFLIGHLALALILLDGGLRTRLSTFRAGFRPAMALATVGVVLTGALCGLLAMWLLDLSLIEGLLVGAIVGSTDAAAVFSLLGGRGTHLNERVAATLEIESGTNDPMAIFLTLTLIDILSGAIGSPAGVMLFLLQQAGVGLLIGLLGGRAIARLLCWIELAPGLYALLTLGLGFVLFGLTSVLGGSGFLAIYLAGLMIGNRPGRHLNFILPVNDGLASLSQIGLFVVLGLLVNPSELVRYAVPGVLLGLGLIFVARPLAVILTLLPFRFRWKEVTFIAWVGLRGAVPVVLAIFPLISGVENASVYFNAAFAVVLTSLLLQGGTLGQVARWLGIEVPADFEPRARIPLGISPEDDHEMFVYPLDNDRLDGHSIRMLRLPSGALIAALFREGTLVHAKGSTQLQRGDTVCVIGRTQDLPALNRLFGEGEKLRQSNAFFGAFVIKGEARLGEVAAIYGLSLSPGEDERSVAEFISQRVGGHPVVGDDVGWHGIHWVVKEVEGDQVTRVGIRFY